MRLPPYLPFLAGPPDFVVGLKPIEPAAWLYPDTEAHILPEKRALLAHSRRAVFAETPGSASAQAELAATVGGDDFLAVAGMVSDDFCLMEKHGPDWVLSAATLCAPTFWSLPENIGKPVAHLHGPVPDTLGPSGAQGLAARIARMFDAVAPGVIMERFNWTVQAGPERFTPSQGPLIERANATPVAQAGDLLHMRVERQTIQKLPQTGAVVFTIRICIDPLMAVFAVDGARDAFAKAWRGAAPHVRLYKKWAPLERHVAALLAS
ncbi:MAG: heme-dependent oxidative N-demethylase subunit alpha family protein [Alphaproteobacteria bacterium]